MQLPSSLILIHLGILSISMGFAWYLLGRWNRRGYVDLLWALAIGLQALVYAYMSTGWLPRRILFAGLGLIWALRLGYHLFRRLNRDGEDGRYLAMAKATEKRSSLFFFGFFQFQAIAAWIFAIPFAGLVQQTTPHIRLWESLALALWIMALSGNSLADHQLDKWRREPQNRGFTCRQGLWAWCRHPNYFFEWLVWCAYAVAAIGTPLFLLQLATAILMLLTITRITGIPFNEKQALRSRGSDYREYQKTTPAFFPRKP